MRGLITIEKIRPDGYEYPVGLTPLTKLTSFNAATNTTGGTQTIDGSNTVHTFTSSGFFVPSFTANVEYLVVGAGGAGGYDGGGGGLS